MAILFHKSGTHAYMIVAGILDVILSVACLALFFRAEVERCCDCDKTTLYRYLASEDNTLSCDPYHYCCPKFGDRLCGGVGSLEPISSIIAFRLLRFAVAKRLQQIYEKCRPQEAVSRETVSADAEANGGNSSDVDLNVLPNISASDEKMMKKSMDSNAGEALDFEHDAGTIAELWALALSKYPDIVKEHGMFSGLLLEAMLGIAPVTSTVDQANESIEEEKKMPPVPGFVSPSSFRKTSKYYRQISSGSIVEETNDDNHYNFIRPASALIRSMRRCQCKWLPLLDDWEVVDVVVTKYELVWFGSKSISGLWDEHIDSKRDAVQNALRANKGGKGMRLCDVAVGREILGRLPLSDIDQIKVQRFPPGGKMLPTRKRKKNDVENGIISSDFNAEFWADLNRINQTHEGDLDDRWTPVMEDDLMLHSPQGTLHLRFLVDLLDEEALGGNPDSSKDIQQTFRTKGALLWCQTVSHVCGPQQLKQKLPHFGEERREELLDFVEVADKKKTFKSLTRSFV